MLSRRQFLLVIMASSFGYSAVQKKRLLMGDGFQKSGSPFDIDTSLNPGALTISNGRILERIPCSFLPHFITARRENPNRAYAFEKWGTQAAEFDLKQRKVIREFPALRGRRYFGHGVTGKDTVFATQMDDVNQTGLLVALGGPAYSTKGTYPHDCQWSTNGKHIIVLNSHVTSKTSPSSLVWINPKNGSIDREVILQNQAGGYAHFAQLKSGDIIVGGATETAPMLALLSNNEISPFELPAQLRGEALSLFPNEATNTIHVSFPLSNEVHVWNYQTKKHLKKIQVLEPRAIVNWNEEPVFSSSREKSWVGSNQISLFKGGSGSHATLL